MTFSPRKSFNNGELPGNTAPRGGPVCPSDESAPAARATRAPRPPGGEAWLLGILYRYLRTAPIITCGNAEATLRNRKRTETRAERCLPPWPRRTTAAGPHRHLHPTDTIRFPVFVPLADRVVFVRQPTTTSGATASPLRPPPKAPSNRPAQKFTLVCRKVFLGVDRCRIWSIVCSRSNVGASGNERRATC